MTALLTPLHGTSHHISTVVSLVSPSSSSLSCLVGFHRPQYTVSLSLNMHMRSQSKRTLCLEQRAFLKHLLLLHGISVAQRVLHRAGSYTAKVRILKIWSLICFKLTIFIIEFHAIIIIWRDLDNPTKMCRPSYNPSSM